MCGIFGFFGSAARLPSQRNAEAALSSISHRGPDAHGLMWRPEHHLVLGHTRLSIIDPTPRSDQPFQTDRCSLVFNGEIYNYRSLRNELLALGVQFHTHGDTEVIVRGYEVWGEQIFDRLRGMYALALYDELQHQLYLARDEFGIKPLCFLQRGNAITFASEIKAIATLESLSINSNVLIDILSWGFLVEDASLYAEVKYLEPGAIMAITFSSNRLQTKTREGWFARRAYESPGKPTGQHNLHKTITDSVADHLIADVPVAVALSGGLDSSVVAAAASTLHPGLQAFTFTLSSCDDPEVRHAAKLCQHLGMEHRVAKFTTGNSEGWLRKLAWHLEEPIANINGLLSYGLAALVRAQGFKVILVGEGADELFAGYPWYQFALDNSAPKNHGKIFDAYFKRRAQSSFNGFLQPGTAELAATRLKQHRQNFTDRLATIKHSALDGFLSYDQSFQLQYSQLLRVDRMFMAHGVEARVPFLYRSVLQDSARMPDKLKLNPGAPGRNEKIALAQAFAPQLPHEVANRPKFGETGTVNIWNTWLAGAVESEFDRCLNSDELRGARQLLDEFVDWQKLKERKLSPKEKFTAALLLEAVDAVLLSRRTHDDSLPFEWEMLKC